MTVLGGNMRTLALRKTGAKECTAKIVKGLTEAQKREFVIKDNGSMGEWDFDLLANNWSDLPLDDWGVDLLEDFMSKDAFFGEQDSSEDSDSKKQITICPKCGFKWSEE
jgi:hypothetical protein